MMRSAFGILLLFCVGITFLPAKKNILSMIQEKQWQPGVLIVKMKSTVPIFPKIEIASELLSLKTKYSVQSIDRLITSVPKHVMVGREVLERIFIFRTSVSANILLLARELSQESSVEYAEPNYILTSHSTPNDPLFNQIHPLAIVQADTAWSIQKGDSTVVIGIIDTGVDWDHPDLAASIWKNVNEIPGNNIDDDGNGFIDDVRGWDFLENGFDAFFGEDSAAQDNDPMDFNGHGTHVAGIAAGCTNNGIGIASLSWGCKIMPLRIGWHTKNGNGFGYSADMAKAFVYAADNCASICNLSFGTTGAVLDGALYAFKNGVVIVNSAGNSNSDESSVLGSQSWALSVAATNSDDKKASYSTFHSSVDVSAPGGDFSSGNFQGFLSTIIHPSSFYGNQEYAQFQGTSMASPFVASLAGLIKSKHRNWSPAKIMFQIVETADNIDSKNPLFVKKLGSGRINALRALTETVSAKPKLNIISVVVDDSKSGNGNGLLDPGETANINCIVRNDWGDALNATAELRCTNPSVSIVKNISSYGTIYGISNIDSSQKRCADEGFKIAVNANALPQSISFNVTIMSEGGYATQLPFELTISAKLLFVDDDDGLNNVEQYYINSFNHLGIVYDSWNRNANGELPFDYLQKYKAVVWACEWAFPSLDISDRNILTTYLNSGGNLFLSGQDIGWDLADSVGSEFLLSNGASKVFYEKYLKTKYISDDAKNDILSGIYSNNISNTLMISRYQPGRTFSEQFPDVIDTVNGSNYCFLFNGGIFIGRGGAISYSKDYKLVHFGFGGFESISDSVKRNIVMERIVKFLSPEIVMTNVSSKNSNQIPIAFSLEQNFPNPFNPLTKIRYSISQPSFVTLKVYDMLGREIQTLIQSYQTKGEYRIPFNASDCASGIYYYRLSTPQFVDTKKMILLK